MGIQTSLVPTQAADITLPMKRTSPAPEGIQRVPQPHRGQHHKRVRLLYGAEFQLGNMPTIIKRGLQGKSPCWVTLWENYSLGPNILSITLDQISGCHPVLSNFELLYWFELSLSSHRIVISQSLLRVSLNLFQVCPLLTLEVLACSDLFLLHFDPCLNSFFQIFSTKRSPGLLIL